MSFASAGEVVVNIGIIIALLSSVIKGRIITVASTVAIAVIQGASAATFYVATNGSDSNPGTQSYPFATVQQAVDRAASGDRIVLAPGEYREVVTTKNAGGSGGEIILDGQKGANIHRLIVNQPNWIIQNLTISGYTNTWFHGLVEISRGAHHTIISNCYIKPTIPYLGGVEFDQGAIKPFDDNAPNNCLIVSNVITGVIGRQAFNIFGTNNIFLYNTVTNLYKSDFVRLWGRWNILRGNTFSNMLDHAVSNHPDFIQTFGQNGDGSKGHIIEGNVVSDIPNGQLSQLTRSDGFTDPLANSPQEMADWTFRNNIFRNISLQASCSIPGTKWYNNVFYRCNYDGGHALVFGDGVRGNADGFRVINNVFLNCGREGTFNAGWYASVRPDGRAWDDAIFDWNYVAKNGTEPVQSQNPPSAFRWYEPHGINGGIHNFSDYLTFGLQRGSVLIDGGQDLRHQGVAADFIGSARPFGNAFDVGAREFSGGSEPTNSVPSLFVSVTGSDNGNGTLANPWRTIQKAADNAEPGDQIIVKAGDYGEYVALIRGGAVGKKVRLVADGKVTLRAFRFQAPNIEVDGFTFTGAQNIWSAHCRIENNAHNTEIRNCFFGPGVFVISDDFKFDASNNSVSSPSVDFKAAGFVPGGQVYFGASGLEQYWYANHDTDSTVSSVTSTQIFLSKPLVAETNHSAWAPIFAGANSAGYEGINFIVASGEAASNCTFSGNTFSNLFGCPITLQGNGHVVANNTFTQLNSYYGIRPNGSDHLIYSNLWYNCRNFLLYTPEELATIPHPMGASWYDYQVGFIHVPGGGTNVQFFNNWIEDVHNPLGQINEVAGAYGFSIRNNVFVGVAANLSGGRHGLVIESNTFFRAGYDFPVAAALTVGGNSSARPAYDMSIQRNAFIDVGSRRSFNTEGYYSLVNALNSVADYNFVAAPETTGWAGKQSFDESNGVNGGDPLLVNADNPRGPDGIPFTSDDGLRPLPNSPLARGGFGALAPVARPEGAPIAHFSISAISTGLQWYDKVGYDFNPAWTTLPPFKRGNKVRPYWTAEALGDAPVTVEFSASNSIGGVSADSSDWVGVTRFTWDFGDSVRKDTTQPTVSHTFVSSGQFTVRLTVLNSQGNTHTTTKTYRVLGGVDTGRPISPRNIRIILP